MQELINKKIKYGIFAAVLILIMSIIGCVSIDRIGVGSVGVKVKLAGSGRGVQDMQIKTGWVLFNPLTEEIIEFPTKVENVIWSASPHEGLAKGEKAGTGVDESVTFSSIDGAACNVDLGLSFHIEPTLAPKLYARFRQNDMRELAYGYMRNIVRNELAETASQMSIQEVYGAGKTKMLNDTLAKVRKILGEDGIMVDQLTINGSLRLPPNVAEAINNAMSQTQRAVEAENKVRQIKAEAEQRVAQATGEADAQRTKAQGEADALIIRTKADNTTRLSIADAQAQANKTLQPTLTPQVISFRAIDQWDGKMPQVTNGNALPMLNIRQ